MAMDHGVGTRERLIEATIDLISQQGEAGLRVENVAAAAGVSKASVYHFFGDREGLVVAALAEEYRRLLARGTSRFDELLRCETREEFVANLLEGLAIFVTPEGAAARRKRVQVLGSAVTRPALRAAIEEVQSDVTAEFAKFLAITQKLGWVERNFAPEVLAEWALSVILGRHIIDDYGSDIARAGWLAACQAAASQLFFGGMVPVSAQPSRSR